MLQSSVGLGNPSQYVSVQRQRSQSAGIARSQQRPARPSLAKAANELPLRAPDVLLAEYLPLAQSSALENSLPSGVDDQAVMRVWARCDSPFSEG
nr:hypothetical protein CFP56_65531 [Quercus suber]